MKKVFFLLIIILLVWCQFSKEKMIATPYLFTQNGDSYITFYDVKSKLYGYVDLNGNIFQLPMYRFAFSFQNGTAICARGKDPTIWSILDSKRNEITLESITPSFEFAFSEGVIPAYDQIKMLYGYLSHDGKWLIPPIYEKARSFMHGLAPVQDKKTEKWGYINKKNEKVIDFKFDFAGPFSKDEKIATVGLAGLVGFIDTNGDTIIDFKFIDNTNEFTCLFQEGYCFVNEDSQQTLIDTKGNILDTFYIDEKYDMFTTMSLLSRQVCNGYYFDCVEPGKYGFKNLKREWVIKPQYFSVSNFKNGRAIVNKVKDGEYSESYIIDIEGNIILNARDIP